MKTQGKSYEADNITGVNHGGPDANVPVERLTATSIIGDGVENMREEDLGKVDNLMVNLRTGEIEYAVIEFGSFLGMGGKLFAVPFGELKVDPIRKKFILNRSKEELKNIPGFDKNHWPDTNDHSYFDDVNTYWGATYQP
jgi:hypothetical protein